MKSITKILWYQQTILEVLSLRGYGGWMRIVDISANWRDPNFNHAYKDLVSNGKILLSKGSICLSV